MKKDQKTTKVSSKIEEKTLVPSNLLEKVQSDMDDAIQQLLAITGDSTMSEADRRRLLGSGVRRYGFIDKTTDIGTANPEFAPPFLDLQALRDLIRQIEVLRNINASLQQLIRLNGDLLLTTSDEAFRLALMYYNSVRDASRRRVPGAQAIFRILQLFFSRRRPTSDQPTDAEIERDVRALLKGKKDGEIIIKNQRPTTVSGKRTIVDETRRDKVAVEVKNDL
jgi:hypothetical protein